MVSLHNPTFTHSKPSYASVASVPNINNSPSKNNYNTNSINDPLLSIFLV